MVCVQGEGGMDAKLYFWDIELDTVQYFNFETGRGEQDDYPSPSGEDEDEDTNDAERYLKQITVFVGVCKCRSRWSHL